MLLSNSSALKYSPVTVGVLLPKLNILRIIPFITILIREMHKSICQSLILEVGSNAQLGIQFTEKPNRPKDLPTGNTAPLH